MRALDPLLFLGGHRGAIERIAATRHAWVVGALLVLTAGVARNYDHLDLLSEPEWFVGPFAASMVSIIFIYLCIRGPLKLQLIPEARGQFLTFLTLAWMTAPCAWLYGIPVEAITDIVSATKWNIAFLLIVSLWRVALMTRAVAVLAGVSARRALPLILAPAAFEAMIGSYFKALSLVQVMGGVRLPPHTELLKNASHFVTVASFWVLLVSLVACWIVKGTAARPLSREKSQRLHPALLVALASLLVWTAIALPFHERTANKAQLERLLSDRDYPAAVAFASSKSREEFLRIHHLPPGPARWFPFGELLDALPADAPEWLRDEWEVSAIESMTTSLVVMNQASWEGLAARHPRVTEGVVRYAAELEQRSKLTHFETMWLNQFRRLVPAATPEPILTPSPNP